jgi:hypothetical protein
MAILKAKAARHETPFIMKTVKKNLPLIIRANTTRKNFNCKIANKRFD